MIRRILGFILPSIKTYWKFFLGVLVVVALYCNLVHKPINSLQESLRESQDFRKAIQGELIRTKNLLGACVQDKDVISVECKFEGGVGADENISNIDSNLSNLTF